MSALDGRAGLVTGAASGIGRASAIALAGAGGSVVVSDLAARRADGEETVARIEATGGTATFVDCDVSSAADCQALVDVTLERYGRLDFAHNNAGIDHQALLVETDDADFQRVLAVNLWGVFWGMKAQIAAMARDGGGAIVNTSSLAGVIGAPTLGAYVASKHAVLGLTRTAAKEYAAQGIRVNAICPAAVRTGITDKLPPEIHDVLPEIQAIKRYAEPEEIAAAVLWLCTDAASFVTGAAMPIDGGATA
jgi:NAD(P)-dependent dehydrogenase (short-subunit alcohol dehydrogenase family)